MPHIVFNFRNPVVSIPFYACFLYFPVITRSKLAIDKNCNLTLNQAKALARLGKFSHAKLSAKALNNVNPNTGEISNGPVLATVSLFLKLNPEEVQQVLRLKTEFELNDALNHKS